MNQIYIPWGMTLYLLMLMRLVTPFVASDCQRSLFLTLIIIIFKFWIEMYIKILFFKQRIEMYVKISVLNQNVRQRIFLKALNWSFKMRDWNVWWNITNGTHFRANFIFYKNREWKIRNQHFNFPPWIVLLHQCQPRTKHSVTTIANVPPWTWHFHP